MLPPRVLGEEDAAKLFEPGGRIVEDVEDGGALADRERDMRVVVVERPLERAGCLEVALVGEKPDEVGDEIVADGDAGAVIRRPGIGQVLAIR